MKYNPSNQIDIYNAKKRFEKLITGSNLFELKEIKPIRSNQQNRYLHMIIGWVANETGDTREEVKEVIFKQIANKDIFVKHFEVDGERYIFLRSTSDLDTAEMTTAIERFRNYMGAGGIYIPAPNETEWLKQIEAEMSRDRYL